VIEQVILRESGLSLRNTDTGKSDTEIRAKRFVVISGERDNPQDYGNSFAGIIGLCTPGDMLLGPRPSINNAAEASPA